MPQSAIPDGQTGRPPGPPQVGPAAGRSAPSAIAAAAPGEPSAGFPAERIETFAYPADPHAPPDAAWGAWEVSTSPAAAPAETPATLAAAFEQRLAEETRRVFEAGRERGQEEQRKAAATELAAAREREKQHRAQLAEAFVAERDRYLHQVEQEVVRLALAVAARILRREAQMDPLLLTGAVRVALGQLSASTEVRLRVPAGDLALWTEAMALLPNLPVKPAVEGDDGLRLGECLVESRLGTVDLGVRSQLGEIERGFFDRAGPRSPRPAPQSVAQPSLDGGSARERSA
jgi:flagellar assembly protein FliH